MNSSLSSADESVVQQYCEFLRQHRGLCRGSVRNHERICETLLQFLRERGHWGLASLEPAQILEFQISVSGRWSRTTLNCKCSELRGFCGFLYRRGVTQRNLSLCVLSPRVYKHEGCPRFLTIAEIDAVLAVIDRDTAVGRRNYAMLLLLATYGLRAGEIVRLHLEAIDWRKEQLHIVSRKAGNSTVYPLDVNVGRAILSYLEQGRPSCEHREVFLSSLEPHGPFSTGAIVSTQARTYIAKAGLRVERSGSHVFRYSCAQRLFERGLPLKTIGDFLGHGDLESTRRYTKIAFSQLREVALGDGEDVL